jgi:hypothetical protein
MSIPQSDRVLPGFSQNLTTKVQAKTDHYGVSEGLAAQLQVDADSYIQALAVADNPATRTRMAISEKNLSKKNLIFTCREVARVIQANPDVTNVIRLDLGLPVHKTPAPIPAPAEAPVLDVLSVNGWTIRLRLHSESERAKPVGAAGAHLYCFVGDTAPAELSAWRPLADVTHSLTDVTVADAEPGARVWLLGRWFNAKLQNGPLSQAVSTRVQGSVKDSGFQAGVAGQLPAAGVRKAA